MGTTDTIQITATAMTAVFEQALLDNGFHQADAKALAAVFTANSIDGVYTHGVNRFPRFIQYVRKGWVIPHARPVRAGGFGSVEQWDGQLGPGVLNAQAATDRAMSLASTHGIGCVALRNTNHWMRGGTYGWQAARSGYFFIGWTNTMGNLPPWGSAEPRLGNNPLVIAAPFADEAIVLDMAMSQFSFGAMELAVLKKERLAVPGGYDQAGVLTTEPGDILQSRRALPIGYWKGSGLSLLLDVLATALSGGLATHAVSGREGEFGLSQVFICIDAGRLPHTSSIPGLLDSIIRDYLAAPAIDSSKPVSYPGQRVLATRQRNMEKGIPVQAPIWEQVMSLANDGSSKKSNGFD